MLPNETNVERDIAAKYARELEAMTSLHDAVLGMLTTGSWTITRAKGMPRFAAETIVGLLTKACKTFRAIQWLVERGLHDDATALARVLMETTVAILFILQRSSRRRMLMYHGFAAAQSLKMV